MTEAEDPLRLAAVQALFEQASSLPPERRESFLREAVGEDHAMADRVLALLGQADVDVTRVFREAVHESLPEPAVARPSQIGSYRILDTLGEGGMGTVYLAEQSGPVARQVALKVIKPGMDSRAILARFAQERQTLAMMQHDGIAKVFDCGTTGQGQPYFVMELVKGVPITTYCEQHQLELGDRLRLVQQVCAAVQHAHQKGVVHRDLTPRNVLVTAGDGAPQIKIIDFGLAKSMGPRLSSDAPVTLVGTLMGTPDYMSPEQADLTNADIDTRSDIYSIGAVLYEVLVSVPPFAGTGLSDGDYHEMRRILRTVDAERPSARLHDLARAEQLSRTRRMTVGALRAALVGDLDWLVLKALDKDRNRRYQTAGAFGADLQRFLDGEPLLAGPPSTAYRLRKFARRHRGAMAATAAVLLASLVFGGLAVRHSLRADRSLRQFEQLAAVLDHDRLLERQQRLGPPWPENAAVMRQWLADADRLLVQKEELEQSVAQLEAQRGDDEQQHQTFLREQLGQLLPRLDALSVRRDHVSRNLRFATMLEGRPPRGNVGWDEVRAGLADGPYAAQPVELTDRDVIGLVPIGRNPQSGLWEFYDLRSAWDGEQELAAIPIPRFAARDGEPGSITVGSATGIVLVLLPGGTCTIGVQSDEESALVAKYALANESAANIELAPFFLSRFELTQGQWQRLWTWAPELRDPSEYGPRKGYIHERTHPVEQVDWWTCQLLVGQCGLQLPTEQQWEYGCRAGSTGPWCCPGDQLKDFANLADLSAREVDSTPMPPEQWKDGWPLHAPVGSFKPNAFGLHDMHGNVWEWCADAFLEEPGEPRRVFRGGSYWDTANYARAARRMPFVPSFRFFHLGLRPARGLGRVG